MLISRSHDFTRLIWIFALRPFDSLWCWASKGLGGVNWASKGCWIHVRFWTLQQAFELREMALSLAGDDEAPNPAEEAGASEPSIVSWVKLVKLVKLVRLDLLIWAGSTFERWPASRQQVLWESYCKSLHSESSKKSSCSIFGLDFRWSWTSSVEATSASQFAQFESVHALSSVRRRCHLGMGPWMPPTVSFLPEVRCWHQRSNAHLRVFPLLPRVVDVRRETQAEAGPCRSCFNVYCSVARRRAAVALETSKGQCQQNGGLSQRWVYCTLSLRKAPQMWRTTKTSFRCVSQSVEEAELCDHIFDPALITLGNPRKWRSKTIRRQSGTELEHYFCMSHCRTFF